MVHSGRPILLALAVLALLTACGRYATPRYAEGPRPGQIPPSYTVVRGDTLFSIAWQYGEDYRTVAAWNGIHPPYTIYPGQVIRLSAPPVKLARPAEHHRVEHHAAPAARQVASRAQPPRPLPGAVVHGPLHWDWPTSGTIAQSFQGNAEGKKGIDIAGRRGQMVRAAAPGQVVYSGSGLIGYGKLIIIKHNETFLSAYAYNDRLLVGENDVVKEGQKIAEMGGTGAQDAVLHFEIRRNGKPVDPVKYLPKR